MWIAIELPFRLAFEGYYGPLMLTIAEVLELVVDFVFILDFLRQFNLAYIDRDAGLAEVRRDRIIRRCESEPAHASKLYHLHTPLCSLSAILPIFADVMHSIRL